MSRKASGIQDIDPIFNLRQAWLATLPMAFNTDGNGNGEDEEKDDETGGNNGGDGGTDDSGNEGTNDDTGGGTDDDVKNPRLKQLSEENARRRNEAKAEKDRADTLAKKLREYEDKDKTELEKAQRDAKELGEKVETLTVQLADARLELSFFKSGAAGQLQDPADALKFLNLKDLKPGDDGTIADKDVLDAVTDLLKRKPYLTKTDGGSTDDGEGSGSPSGRQTNSRKKKEDSNRAALEEKFPALKGR